MKLNHEITNTVVRQAIACGASLAGVVSVEALRESPSHLQEPVADWETRGRSIIVLALLHDKDHPRLDWWDGDWGTSGNRRLIEAGRNLIRWLQEVHNLRAWDLPYYPSRGGVFLKDAAVLAGLGVIGRNNLLLTSQNGPLVRLRALGCEAVMPPSPKMDTDPCAGCAMPCRRKCPQDAFQSGEFVREKCQTQMTLDEDSALPESGGLKPVIRYCRACEFHCPLCN